MRRRAAKKPKGSGAGKGKRGVHLSGRSGPRPSGGSSRRARGYRGGKRSGSVPRSRSGGQAKGLLVVLILLLVSGVAAVKYMQSPAGQAQLLDMGVDGYFPILQERMSVALEGLLASLALNQDVRKRFLPSELASDPHQRVIQVEVPCDPAHDLVALNLEITALAGRVGLRVRECREEADGRELVMKIGTRRHTTHRLILRREGGSAPKPLAAREPLAQGARLALVIDDLGYNSSGLVDSILALPIPLTVSVLPELRYSRYVLFRAMAAGKQALLHLPMEPEDDRPSDIPMVRVGMGDDDIRNLVEGYLEGVPGVVGVNNHMGSRATQDARVMGAVLEVLKKHHLFFLDSLTSPRSLAYNAAVEMGLNAVRNDLFLDDDTSDLNVIAARLERLVDLARDRGVAVGIGHPKAATLEVLQQKLPYLENSGVELVFVSELAAKAAARVP